MAGGGNSDDVSGQAWPGFVDIMASTVLVLCFALLVLVLLLSITKITSSRGKDGNESGPSSYQVEADVLGEYRAEFQKLAIVANPSLRKEMTTQSDQPSSTTSSVPYYVPAESHKVDKPQDVSEAGDDRKQVLGDTPKVIDSKSLDVLKELIIVQRDVIEQQRKVIEQKDTQIVKSVRSYQSLLSLVTKAKDVEDLRQKINPKDNQALFSDVDMNGEKLTGAVDKPKGSGNYVLNPPSYPTASVQSKIAGDGVVFNFQDNASFLTEKDYNSVKETLSKNLSSYKASGVVLESKISDYALSGAEASRIAVDRLLIFRSLLIELGVSPTSITLKTIKQSDKKDDQNQEQEENYGWINVKAKK